MSSAQIARVVQQSHGDCFMSFPARICLWQSKQSGIKQIRGLRNLIFHRHGRSSSFVSLLRTERETRVVVDVRNHSYDCKFIAFRSVWSSDQKLMVLSCLCGLTRLGIYAQSSRRSRWLRGSRGQRNSNNRRPEMHPKMGPL